MAVPQWVSLSQCIFYTRLWEKQLSIKFYVAQPDGSPPVAINAWFALRRTAETGHGVSRNEDNWQQLINFRSSYQFFTLCGSTILCYPGRTPGIWLIVNKEGSSWVYEIGLLSQDSNHSGEWHALGGPDLRRAFGCSPQYAVAPAPSPRVSLLKIYIRM